MDPSDSSPNERIPTVLRVGKKKYKLAKRSVLVVRRVTFTAPSGNRCMVTNQANSRFTIAKTGIQLCHAFGRANSLEDERMRSVEFTWGMTRNSVNLDSRYNCFYCTSNFHIMHDNGYWCIMPDLDLVQRYYDAMRRDDGGHGVELAKEIQKDDKKIHEYTLVAFITDMESTDIDVYVDKSLRGEGPKKITYEFPFQNLPKIRSHLHPKFVLLNVGAVLEKPHITAAVMDQDHLAPYSDAFGLIQRMYRVCWKEISAVKDMDPAFAPKTAFSDMAEKAVLDARTPAHGKGSRKGVRKSVSLANLRSSTTVNGRFAAHSPLTIRLPIRTVRTVANLRDANKRASESSTSAEAQESTPKLTITIRLGKRIPLKEVNGEGDDEDDVEEEANIDDVDGDDLGDVPDTDDEGEHRNPKKRQADSDSSPDVSPPPSPTTLGGFSHNSRASSSVRSAPVSFKLTLRGPSAPVAKPSKKKIRRK
ncbi:hypothetical protein CVT24_010692 [Panaeolus cyanescens]|uniref:HNH nuclease domain-containing protein n=1 Tax=Panaeolus cyanescens TaxID=181874 RepID=A0A409YM87_9AGAR|nr:hypothetical protein CVT24_010692 [Panaeolus cyanescens]